MSPYNEFKICNSDNPDKVIFEYKGRYFEGGIAMATLLNCMKESATEEEGIQNFYGLSNGKISKNLIRQVLDKSFKHIYNSNPPEDKSFIWSKQLIKADFVNRFTTSFRNLFDYRLIIITMILALISNVTLLCLDKRIWSFDGYVSAEGLFGIIFFIITSSFIHELGHASACSAYNIKSGGIGLGLYINFPVMYTDVSNIWCLPIKQRIIVNIAGIYFQSYLIIILIMIYLITASVYIKYLIISLDIGIILTLNPIFKFDGYWIACDVLKISNLRQRTHQSIIYLYKRLKGDTIDSDLFRGMDNKKKYIFIVYCIISNVFFLFFFLYVIPNFLFMFIQVFPDEITLLFQYINNRILPPFSLVKDVLSQLLFITFLAYWLYLALKNIIINFK